MLGMKANHYIHYITHVFGITNIRVLQQATASAAPLLCIAGMSGCSTTPYPQSQFVQHNQHHFVQHNQHQVANNMLQQHIHPPNNLLHNTPQYIMHSNHGVPQTPHCPSSTSKGKHELKDDNMIKRGKERENKKRTTTPRQPH